MNVLVIDDQENVVNGMIKGVDWDRLRIDGVYTAYNSREARNVIQQYKIDIMLCDIEMPGGNGLDLFAWAKEYDREMECIFLTAHADFDFAKEAIRLGGFDYILQPAPYEEIEEAILKVCKRIQAEREMRRYSTYGKEFYGDKEILLEGFLKEWMTGGVRLEEFLKNLIRFQVELAPDTAAVFGILHIFDWENRGERLEGSLLKYAVSNILSELFEGRGMKVLIAWLETDQYGLLLYQDGEEKSSGEDIREVLEDFLTICKNFYGGTAACYTGGLCIMQKQEEELQKVWQLQKDNVARNSGVFTAGRDGSRIPDTGWMKERMKDWPQELAGGKAECVERQAITWLDSGNLNAKTLRRFYMEFMQVVSNACEQIGTSTYQIFGGKEDTEQTLQAYRSVDEMKRMVGQAAAFFQKNGGEDDGGYVDTVIAYIHCNIEKDIRRGELAQAVNLNEDYLSRIFKKEKGIALKEYIILEKMRTAQNLLLNTTFSVSMIGAKVGFTNFSHFSQTYRKIMGKTPIEERNRSEM